MMVPKMQKFSRPVLRIQVIQASTCRKFVSWGGMVGVIFIVENNPEHEIHWTKLWTKLYECF